MSLRTDFYSRLSTHTGLTSLINKRMYLPKMVPNDVIWPFLTYSVAARERIYSHQGFTGTTKYRLRVRIFATNIEGGDTSSAQVDDISVQVIDAMENWSTVNSKIRMCLHDGEEDLEEETEYEYDQLPIYFKASYEED